MDAGFRSVAMRLMRSLGQEVDPEFFSEEDCWAFVGDLAQYAKENKQLPAQILLDLGVAMGLKPGAPEAHFLPALEAQLGQSPHAAQTIAEVVRYIRTQANGLFEDAPPASQSARLTGGAPTGPPHPFKNYDFGSD